MKEGGRVEVGEECGVGCVEWFGAAEGQDGGGGDGEVGWIDDVRESVCNI